MNKTIAVVLLISVILNLLFVAFGSVLIARRGGMSYLASKIPLFNNLKTEAAYSPYHLHRRSQFELLPIHPSDIVFLGDSITAEGEWTELFDRLEIKNRGISGDTTNGVLDRLDGILEAQPKKIFLMIGVNDLLYRRNSVVEVIQRYQDILTKIRAVSANTTVFVQSLLPIHEGLLQKTAVQDIITFNTQLQILAKQVSCQYVDLFPHFLSAEDQLDTQYSLDGLHLNGHAYLTWRQLIKQYIDD